MRLQDMMVENEVRLDMAGNLIYILGEPKSGKSTLYAEFVKDFYGTAKAGYYIPFEEGFSFIKGLNRYNKVIDTWYEFVTLVDILVDEGKELGIKIVGLDTYDRLVDIATKEVLRLSKIKENKRSESLNEAYGGFGRGAQKLEEILYIQLQRLRKAGLCIAVLGHTKMKKLKLKTTGEEYSILGSNLTENIHKIVAKDADLIAMITLEKHIVDGVIQGEERFLRFRANGEYDCGGRIKNLPEKIELNSKLFVETLKKGISEDAEIDYTEYDNKVKEQHKETEIHSEEFKKNDKEDRDIKSLGKPGELVDKIEEAFKDETKKALIISKMKEIACKTFLALRDEEYENIIKVYKVIE